jgi:16S rRNA (guanine966-N2)-methyltransferase
MRIVAGSLGGRVFKAPPGDKTHPMSEATRGALFNILGDISGKTMLDPFGGSGALSFEALSRGAQYATIIERDRVAGNIIKENIADLGLDDRCKQISANCRSWSNSSQDETFDLIICDPPYHDLQLSTVSLLIRHLNPKGLMVLSHSGRGGQVPAVNGVVVVDNRSYGDAALSFYQLG